MAANRFSTNFARAVLIMMVLALSPYFLPTLVMLAIALLPTAVSFFTDRSSVKYKWLAVGAMNIAGTLPALMALWFSHTYSWEMALHLVADVKMLFIIYGAAGIGWGVFLFLPPLMSAYIHYTERKTLAALKAAQMKIIETWGDASTFEEERKETPQTPGP